MSHIPGEILHEIFIKLCLKDRIECMTVSRSWCHMIDRRSILYDLDITSRQYRMLKNIVKRFPYRGAQTEYLKIRLSFRPDFDKRKVCNLFPNLRKLILSIGDIGNPPNHMRIPFKFTSPASKLETLVDYGRCELTRQLVMSKLCNNLKSLTLTLRDSPKSNDRSVVAQLKNMPVLEYLSLTCGSFTLMDLEIIHDNLPTLKSLHLKVSLLPSATPRNVIPAALITKLDAYIYNVQDGRAHIQFYKYIYDKYPSVNKLDCRDDVLLYDVVDYARDLYNEGILPLYQRTGYHNDALLFTNYCDGLDVFRKFDECGVKLKQLTVIPNYLSAVLPLGELVQSQQSSYIDMLTLRYIIPEPMNMLKRMEALTYLEIGSLYPLDDPDYEGVLTINFSQLVEACPATLTVLVLSGLYLTFNEWTLHQTSIECLDIYFIRLEPALAKVIEICFPHLVELLLLDISMESDVTMSLPRHNLNIVDINVNEERDGPNGIVIATINDRKVEYYGLRQTDTCGDGQVVCLSREEFYESPALTLTCASILNLYLEVGSYE